MSREYPIEKGSPFKAVKEYWNFSRISDLPVMPMNGLERGNKTLTYLDSPQLSIFDDSLAHAARVREVQLLKFLGKEFMAG